MQSDGFFLNSVKNLMSRWVADSTKPWNWSLANIWISLSYRKSTNKDVRYTSEHRRRRKQILGGAKDFCSNFPNFPEKLLCDFYLQIFSHKDQDDLFLMWLPKKVLIGFSANRWRHFLSQTTLGAIFIQIFRNFARIFTRSKVWGCICNPCTPASYITDSESVCGLRRKN